MIEVVDPGLLTTVQDRGRPGYAAIGVPPSGAVDIALATHLNRLVGNPDNAPVLETVGGLTLRAVSSVVVAGDTEPVARSLTPGEEIHVAVGGRQWHYVAVRGGFEVPRVLGSCSTDVLSGLGPAPLQQGDRLAVGPEPAAPPVGDVWPVAVIDRAIALTRGPRCDWFTDGAWDAMLHAEWTVANGNRVGVRLAGHRLDRVVTAELPSEGLVRGAIQVPPDGSPIMMLADHPTTGGYPVIAVVAPADVAAVAQRLIGSRFRFRSSE